MVTDETMMPVNGIEVCVETFGEPSDPAVLLIGGATSSMDWWDDEFCRRLAAGARYVIRYDHRDTGRSTSFPAGRPPYSSVDLAHDALGVLDAVGVRRAHLVGMSMGGALAQRIAVERPHRVLSLTLMSTSPGLGEDPIDDQPDGNATNQPDPARPDSAQPDPGQAGSGQPAVEPTSGGAPGTGTATAGAPSAGTANAGAATAGAPSAGTATAGAPSAGAPTAEVPSAGAAQESPDSGEQPDWSNRKASVARIAETVRTLGGAFTADEPQLRRLAERVFDRTQDMAANQVNHFLAEPGGAPIRCRLGEITAPTLVLHGTQDPFLGPEHARALADEIPGARLIWLDGVGHEYPPTAVWPTVIDEILGQGARGRQPA